MVHVALALLVLTGCAPGPSPGTLPEPGSPVDPETECRTVEQILAPAHPEPAAARFLKRLHACPAEAGEAIAGALDTLRTSADTAVIGRVADLVRYVHDERIHSVSADIAADASASVEARIYAFRSLTWSKAPGHELGFGSLLLTRAEAKCGPGSLAFCSTSATGHFYRGYIRGDLRWPAMGRPLAPDFVDAVDRLCTATSEDTAQPADVRQAARHACEWPPDPELLELIEAREN